MLSLVAFGILSATEPSTVAKEVVRWLDRDPDAGLTVIGQWHRGDSYSHALRLGKLACDVPLDGGVRCRELIDADRDSFAYGGRLEGDWDVGVTPPAEASALFDAIGALPWREFVTVSPISLGSKSRAYELRQKNGLQLVFFDGEAHRLSEPLPRVLSVRVDSFPVLDASSLFPKGTRAWGVVLVDGDEGNGNNASGSYSYLLAIFALRDGQLELAATHPLGGTAFSRFVGDDGFHMWNMHTLLCPSVSAGALTLTPSCRGSGEPRDWGAPFSKLCEQARAGRCTSGGSKQDAQILAGAGKFVLREKIFVPSAAKPIRRLSELRARDEENDPSGKKVELFVSERPWVADAEQRIEWIEIENRTANWVDLKELELSPIGSNLPFGKIDDACVIPPKGVVLLVPGTGPSWNPRARECFLGEKAVISGAFRLFGPQGELSTTWSSGGPVNGYSIRCTPQKGCDLGKSSAGVRNPR